MKKAMISGVNGQDGSYLAELLLAKGYEVHGIIRRSSSMNTGRIEHLLQGISRGNSNFCLHYGDMTDASSLSRLVTMLQPDEVYNLAAQSDVMVSFEVPEYTTEVNALGTLRLLEALRDSAPGAKFYQASTSELFGNTVKIPHNEETVFSPCSPYAASKLYSYWIVKIYRKAYKLFAVNGILFNHESPRRGEGFVTRKISKTVANIARGTQQRLYLGNLNSRRDWGYASDYVQMMWLMLQQEEPEDYVLATGETHTVREFTSEAFKVIGINLDWEGEGIKEKGIDRQTGRVLVSVDPQYFRPLEVDLLLGDSSKAKKKLGWQPTVSFKELVELMVKADLNNHE